MKYDRDTFADIFNEHIPEDTLNICNHNFYFIEGYCTCTLCGMIDIHRHAFMMSGGSYKSNTNHLYHRKSYFREKLKLMVGIKQSLNPEYILIIKELKNQLFNSIIELKRIMRKKGYHKYYKYIYNIYYEIKGVKLINLSYTEIDKLTCKFLKLEQQFKTIYPSKSNLLSYNIVIYSLLKKDNHLCYKNIILPKNKRKVLKNIENLVK